jgi:hypothetical protein
MQLGDEKDQGDTEWTSSVIYSVLSPKFTTKFSRHSGIQEFQRFLDAGFHRHDGEETNALFDEFSSSTRRPDEQLSLWM